MATTTATTTPNAACASGDYTDPSTIAGNAPLNINNGTFNKPFYSF